MFLRDAEWLPQATQLPQGRTARADHGCGRTPSMQIGHSATEYWAYCHRCRKGGKQTKEYVMLQRTQRTVEPSNLPEVLLPLHRADDVVQGFIRRSLVAMGASVPVQECMPLFVARERDGTFRHERVYIRTPQGVLSRALIDGAVPKVRNHRDGSGPAQTYAAEYSKNPEADTVVITEDVLSMYKVLWATGVHVLSALGTRLSPAAVYHLLHGGYSNVVVALDGDEAGRTGALKMQQDLEALGFNISVSVLPEDQDPKDLHKHELIELCTVVSP